MTKVSKSVKAMAKRRCLTKQGNLSIAGYKVVLDEKRKAEGYHARLTIILSAQDMTQSGLKLVDILYDVSGSFKIEALLRA